ncbi:MAG: histidine kinase [Ruminococcus sp.]
MPEYYIYAGSGKQYDLIQKLDLCMANYMRYLTHPAEKPVTISQELEHVNNYMTIQTLRYHNCVLFPVKLEDDFMNQYCFIL